MRETDTDEIRCGITIAKGGERVRIAIFGGSGFIGGHLARACAAEGDEVVVVSRQLRTAKDGITFATWRELEELPARLERFDAFVNLAGESINQRWTKRAKERIVQSRLRATAAVARMVDRLQHKPEVVVNGSGMSIYGYADNATFDEDSPPGLTDFLARTVAEWEQAADQIPGVRVVKLRIGLVLGADGGAFPLMALPYRLGVGGKVGSGRQWHSWIHIDDMIGIIRHCIEHPSIVGPVNCTGPEPATNDDFGRAIGRALHRPHWFPVPSFLLKIALGEMSEVLRDGQRVMPKRMLDAGYRFKFPALDAACRNLLKKRGTHAHE